MFEHFFKSLAPHYCLGCGQVGGVLCRECKYNITSEPENICIYCGLPSDDGVCKRHSLPYSRVWLVAQRHGVVEKLINDMKYRSNRSAADASADLLADRLPQLPADAVLVPVPTAARHIRQRGYDHALKIVKRLARLKGVSHQKLIKRRNNLTQVGSSRQQRQINAKQSYAVDSAAVDSAKTYIVVDDVFTTGATAYHACKTLKAAGARRVYLAIVARQDLQ